MEGRTTILAQADDAIRTARLAGKDVHMLMVGAEDWPELCLVLTGAGPDQQLDPVCYQGIPCQRSASLQHGVTPVVRA